MTYHPDDQTLWLGYDCGREELPDETMLTYFGDKVIAALRFASARLTVGMLGDLQERYRNAGGDPSDSDAMEEWMGGDEEAMTFRELHGIAVTVLDALRRELETDSMRLEVGVYPTSDFGVIEVPLRFQPGHPDYREHDGDDEDDEPSDPAEHRRYQLERIEQLETRIAELVDELAGLLAEPDTPDRQYRMDRLNQLIDLHRRMLDESRRTLD